MGIFRKIRKTGEIGYVEETHPTGEAVRLAYHAESSRPEDLEPATEEEYLAYMRLRKFVSVNYSRIVRKMPMLTMEEIDVQNPTVSPVGEMRQKMFRRMAMG